MDGNLTLNAALESLPFSAACFDAVFSSVGIAMAARHAGRGTGTQARSEAGRVYGRQHVRRTYAAMNSAAKPLPVA